MSSICWIHPKGTKLAKLNHCSNAGDVSVLLFLHRSILSSSNLEKAGITCFSCPWPLELSCQNKALCPFPKVMVVEARKRSISTLLQGSSPPVGGRGRSIATKTIANARPCQICPCRQYPDHPAPLAHTVFHPASECHYCQCHARRNYTC